MIEDMKQRGCDCYWIKFDGNKRKTSFAPTVIRLYKLFKRLKPNVINTHLFDDSFVALFAARLAGVKMRVITKGDAAFHWYFTPKWVWADKFNNNNATHIVAISDESRKFILEKEKASPSKVYRIHHGIPIEDIASPNEADKQKFRQEYKLEGKLVIGTISRYIEWKGYRYIIEAARTVTSKYKNVKFLFIGHGEQKEELEALVNKYGLSEFVQFIGWVEKKYMPSLYGVMDIYVHAAVMEPFGLVISEAMASGIPMVTTKTGAAADSLVHKETCYFTENKNSDSIADGIIWMIENPGMRKEMKEKIKKVAHEKFNVDRMLKDYIDLYKGLIR